MIVEISGRELLPPLGPYWWLSHRELVRRDLRGKEGRTRGFHHFHPAPRYRRVAALRAARDRTIRGASRLAAYHTLRRDDEAVCARCCGELTGWRRRWCSDECRRDAEVRCNPGAARAEVHKRDGGVCRQCGRDTEAGKRALERARRSARRRETEAPYREWPSEQHPVRSWWEAVCAALWRGAVRRHRLSAHTWEMEHVVPVVEGGGLCGLDGLATLCLPCHQASTAALAARRAEAARPQMTLELEAARA